MYDNHFTRINQKQISTVDVHVQILAVAPSTNAIADPVRQLVDTSVDRTAALVARQILFVEDRPAERMHVESMLVRVVLQRLEPKASVIRCLGRVTSPTCTENSDSLRQRKEPFSKHVSVEGDGDSVNDGDVVNDSGRSRVTVPVRLCQ